MLCKMLWWLGKAEHLLREMENSKLQSSPDDDMAFLQALDQTNSRVCCIYQCIRVVV